MTFGAYLMLSWGAFVSVVIAWEWWSIRQLKRRERFRRVSERLNEIMDYRGERV